MMVCHSTRHTRKFYAVNEDVNSVENQTKNSLE